jgi:hypothetical protein
VIDLSGKVLMESTQDATSNVYSQELSLSQLPTGLYIVSIQYGNERRNHKVQVIQE